MQPPPPDHGIFITNGKVPCVSEVIHLGHCLNEDIYNFSANKCVGDFNRQCNMFLANFKYSNSYVRNVLFHNNVQLFMVINYFHFLTIVWMMFTLQWRIAMHKVWRVPWTTHCNLLPNLSDVIDPELRFSK